MFYAPLATHYLAPNSTCFFPHSLTLWKQGEFWEVVEPATKYMELDEDERFRELEAERPLETLTFLGSVIFSWQDATPVEEEAFDFEAIADEGIVPSEPAQPVPDAQPPPQILPHADRDELVIDNKVLTPENTLAELRQATLFMGICQIVMSDLRTTLENFGTNHRKFRQFTENFASRPSSGGAGSAGWRTCRYIARARLPGHEVKENILHFMVLGYQDMN